MKRLQIVFTLLICLVVQNLSFFVPCANASPRLSEYHSCEIKVSHESHISESKTPKREVPFSNASDLNVDDSAHHFLLEYTFLSDISQTIKSPSWAYELVEPIIIQSFYPGYYSNLFKPPRA